MINPDISGLSLDNQLITIYDMLNSRIVQLKSGIANMELDFAKFEKQYSLNTKEFYELFMKGELGDENHDFFSMEWRVWSLDTIS